MVKLYFSAYRPKARPEGETTFPSGVTFPPWREPLEADLEVCVTSEAPRNISYEFEFIHPFPDGNGRMGRLWQSLVLSRFHPVFQHLPVETMVHDNQWAYYEAINRSTQNTDCGAFIDFMLGEIRDTLSKHKGETLAEEAKTDQVCDQVTDQVILLLKALKSGEKTSFEARNRLGLRHGPTFRANYLVPALAAGLAEMTQPDSPRSPTQKYRLTDKGRALLATLKTRQGGQRRN